MSGRLRSLLLLTLLVFTIIVLAVGQISFNNKIEKSTKASPGTTEESRPINQGDYYVLLDKSKIKVQIPYSDEETMWIELKNSGLNNSFGFTNFYKSNSSDLDGEFTGSVNVMKSGTDWISPVQVSAENNQDGDNVSEPKFTGGFHGYNGDQTGSETASTMSTEFHIDGKKVTSFDGFAEKEIKIKSTQRIQAWNTTKEDGTGREVLEQTVEYTFHDKKVDVLVKTKALEDVDWTLWYGLQTTHSKGSPWNEKVIYSDGKANIEEKDNKNSDSGEKSESPNIYRFENRGKNNDTVSAWIDNKFELGKRNYVSDNEPLAFNADYGKSYFNIINGETLELNKGEEVNLKGGYEFYKVK